MEIRVREAEYDDVLNLRHTVMYPNESIELAKVDNDSEGIHLGVYEKDEMVACISIFMKDKNLQFRKLATREDFQRKGYGTALVKYIIDFYNQFDLNSLWANARKDCLPFYERLGFEQTEDTFSKNGHEYVIIKYKK